MILRYLDNPARFDHRTDARDIHASDARRNESDRPLAPTRKGNKRRDRRLSVSPPTTRASRKNSGE
jgi:hypothetical protein